MNCLQLVAGKVRIQSTIDTCRPVEMLVAYGMARKSLFFCEKLHRSTPNYAPCSHGIRPAIDQICSSLADGVSAEELEREIYACLMKGL